MASADRPRKKPQQPRRDQVPPGNFERGAADADMRITGGDAFEKDVVVQLDRNRNVSDPDPEIERDREKIFPETTKRVSKKNTPPPT